MAKLIITIILITIAPLTAYYLYREIKYIFNCQIISGKVTHLRSSRGSKGGLTYAPDITVTLPSGEQKLYYHDIYSKPSSYNLGQIVPMGYCNGEIKVMYFMNRFGISLILVSICLSLLLYLAGRYIFERVVSDKISNQLNVEM